MAKNRIEVELATKPDNPYRAGWSINDWCKSVDLARATLYTLPPTLQPSSVKIGKRRIITEQPADFLKRLATQSAALTEAA